MNLAKPRPFIERRRVRSWQAHFFIGKLQCVYLTGFILMLWRADLLFIKKQLLLMRKLLPSKAYWASDSQLLIGDQRIGLILLWLPSMEILLDSNLEYHERHLLFFRSSLDAAIFQLYCFHRIISQYLSFVLPGPERFSKYFQSLHSNWGDTWLEVGHRWNDDNTWHHIHHLHSTVCSLRSKRDDDTRRFHKSPSFADPSGRTILIWLTGRNTAYKACLLWSMSQQELRGWDTNQNTHSPWHCSRNTFKGGASRRSLSN